MQRFLSVEGEKIGPIVCYERMVLLTYDRHELPKQQTAGSTNPE
jgi:hypothetical protein